jgi:hypothetical protein
MKKQLLTALAILGLSSTLVASNPSDSIPNYIYLEFGGGLNKTSVNETLNTSLSYTGITPGFSVGFNAAASNMYFEVKNTFSIGNLSPYKAGKDFNNSMQNIYENLNLNAQWLVFKKPESKFFTYVGPMASAKVQVRGKYSNIVNSAYTYDIAASLGVAAKVDKYVKIDHIFSLPIREQNFKLAFGLSYPLISSVWSQPYSGITENVVQEGGMLIDPSINYLGYFSNYTNIEMNFAVAYLLKNKNAIEISYMHDYNSTQPKYNPSKSLNQMLSLKLYFNFK